MKKSLLVILALPACLALLALSGCESSGVTARIQEKSAAYAALTPAQQQLVKAGEIEIGFTADMVYMALGKPSKTEVKETSGGPVTMWTYDKYYPTQAVQVSLSRDGGMTNAPMLVGANAPSSGLSSGSAGGRAYANTSANTVNSMVSLEPADIPYRTLYVFIYQGQVFQIKLGES